MKKNQKIKVSDIIGPYNLQVVTGQQNLDGEITGGYVGDLLSDVMANTHKGDIWVTRQAHPNIVAVAVLRKLSGIIIINNRKPDEDTIIKANKEKVPIMSCELPAFELVGRLYEFGINGLH
jgi:hypothetical protein